MKGAGACPRVGTDRACDSSCAASGYGTRGPCALTSQLTSAAVKLAPEPNMKGQP
jgi:hypothetical protein